MLLSDNYTKSIQWIFDNTQFEYIMTCLIGLECKEQDIYHYLFENKNRIDRVTGDRICFLYPVIEQLISSASHPILLREKEAIPFNILRREDMYMLPYKITDAVFDECSHIFNFDYCQLPGIIVIGKNNGGFPQFYHIESIHELDLYIDALAIIDSYSRDYIKYETPLLHNRFEIKENLETQLSGLLQEKDVRFRDIEINRDRVISNLVSVLCCHDVSEEDINKLHTRSNLRKTMKEISIKYPMLRDLQIMRSLCKEVRIIHQISSLESKILDIRNRIEKAVSKQDIIALENKREKVYLSYKHKLTKIVLEEELSEKLLQRTTPNLFELCSIISDRSTKVLNKIHTFEEELNSLGYDVFISCKSEDYHVAHELYSFLLTNEHKPFLADYSLREVGTDKYGALIRQVIDKCNHMIVFATNIDYICTEYVRHEWTLFYDEMMAGRKHGKLFAVIPSLKSITELPIEFRNTQCFDIESFEDSILEFLK